MHCVLCCASVGRAWLDRDPDCTILGRSPGCYPTLSSSSGSWCPCTCRVKQYHSRSSQYDQILKKNEQMHALTAITVAMCPAAEQLLDEGVSNLLKEK